ncbi:MAG: Rap1a/Tai family immunity protein [Rhodospirillales bacterium]
MRFGLIGVLLVILSVPGPVNANDETAYFVTGNKFLTSCRAEDNAGHQGFCLGATLAMYDVLSIFSATGNITEPDRICPPKGLIGSQIRDIVVQYVEKNVETRHWPWALLAHDALANSFAGLLFLKQARA